MHRAAASTATAGGTAIQFRHHGVKIAAFGQVMSMRAMVAEYRILHGKRRAYGHGDGFLPDAQMHRAAHFLFGIAVCNGFLYAPDAQHGAKQGKLAGVAHLSLWAISAGW